MAFEVVMPKWGLSMKTGLIIQWLKGEGDRIEEGEALLEVESEKMTAVVEAPASGILARILHPAGSEVPITEVIAMITGPGEPISELPAQAETDEPEPDPTPALAEALTSPSPVPARPGRIRAMPAARRIAKEHGLDLATVQGTGPNGAITITDVERALAAPPVVQPLQKVAFFSEGHRLDGLLYSPEGVGPDEVRAGVVLCVGYTYLKGLVMPDIARALNAAGYVALTFDYRGFGESEGPRWRLIPQEQVNDLRAALTFLSDLPHVDAGRLALAGLSLGGSHAITAGAVDARVGAVVAIQPPGDGERWLRSLRRHYEWQAFEARLTADRSQRVRTGESSRVDPLEIVLPDPDSQTFLEAVYREFPQMKCDLPLETADALIEYRPESSIARLAPRPVLLIHGEEDRLVPAAESRRLFARADEPKQLEILSGVDHFNWVMPQAPHFQQVTDLIVNFLAAHLPAV